MSKEKVVTIYRFSPSLKRKIERYALKCFDDLEKAKAEQDIINGTLDVFIGQRKAELSQRSRLKTQQLHNLTRQLQSDDWNS